MTTQEKLAAVKAKIIEANPEIMELKFGCMVKGNSEIPTLNYVGKSNGQHCLSYKRSNKDELLFVDNLGVEIIGRPITLEDVLMVLNKRCWAVENVRGSIMHWEFDKWVDTPLKWILGHDLDWQAEHNQTLIDWLYEQLK